MSPSQPSSTGDVSVSTSQLENGFIDSVSVVNSEKTVHELLQQTPVHGTDDHLIEFSEALRTVAKALRRAAEGKASAQAEAAEWKRKYEIERARSLQLEQKEKSPVGPSGGFCSGSAENLENGFATDKQLDRCCGEHGICSHEVLFDGEADSQAGKIPNKMMRKASFKLSWWCKGDQSDQHQHDIVSFERGNITTASRSSKQISLKWESPPQTVLIWTKPNSSSVRALCAEMVRWLKEQKNVDIYVEPRVKGELLADSSFFNFVETWQDGKQE